MAERTGTHEPEILVSSTVLEEAAEALAAAGHTGNEGPVTQSELWRMCDYRNCPHLMPSDFRCLNCPHRGKGPDAYEWERVIVFLVACVATFLFAVLAIHGLRELAALGAGCSSFRIAWHLTQLGVGIVGTFTAFHKLWNCDD